MLSAQRDIRKTGWKKSLWFWLGNFLVVVFSAGLLLQAHAAQTVYAKATKLSNKPGWPSGCPSGAFLNTADAGCYKCPSGYSHNSFKFATTSGVCYKRETRKGDEWSCSKTGGFGPKNGKCYKCPSGWTHDLLKAADSSEVCYKQTDTVAIKQPGVCTTGEFDPITWACYSCPSGYGKNPAVSVTSDTACMKSVAEQAEAAGEAVVETASAAANAAKEESCKLILAGLKRGTSGAQAVSKAISPLIAPAKRALDDELNKLSSKVTSNSQVQTALGYAASKLPSGSADELVRIQGKLGSSLQNALLNQAVVCSKTSLRSLDTTLSNLGLRSSLGKFAAFSFSLSVPAGSINTNMGITYVTDFNGQRGLFASFGGSLPYSPDASAGVSAMYSLNAQRVSDFGGPPDGSFGLGIGAGDKIKTAFPAAAKFPDSLDLDINLLKAKLNGVGISKGIASATVGKGESASRKVDVSGSVGVSIALIK